MSNKPFTVIKVLVYVVLPVSLLIALAWMNTFHGDTAWVQLAWRGFWFVVLPILILAGGRIALRSRKASDDSNKTGR
jgi:chromate transport protein ChrA